MSAYRKIIFVVIFFVLVLSLVAFGLISLWINPGMDTIATATVAARAVATREARIAASATSHAATLTAQPTLTPTQTASPTPTLSPTLTSTMTLIPTITLTPTPELTRCKAQLVSGGMLYVSPSKGSSVFTGSGELFALAQANKTRWYYVEISGEHAWAAAEDIDLKSCAPISTETTYLTHWEDTGGTRVFWDDFYAGKIWVSNDDKLNKINAIPKKYAYVLSLDSSSATKQFYPQAQPFDALQEFSLYTSYSVISLGTNGYIGLRLGEDSSNYYEIRIDSSCNVDIYQIEEQIARKLSLPGNRQCFGGNENFLNVQLAQSSGQKTTLKILMNKGLEYEISLPSSYKLSEFRWALNNARIDVEYIAVLGKQ